MEDERKEYVLKLNLGDRISSDSYINYLEGEQIFQRSGFTGATASEATATATVIDWNSTTKILQISNGKEIIFFYLDLKDLVCINTHQNMQIF